MSPDPTGLHCSVGVARGTMELNAGLSETNIGKGSNLIFSFWAKISQLAAEECPIT